jgi:hypothetical protein
VQPTDHMMDQHTVWPDSFLYKHKQFCTFSCIFITKDYYVLKICSLSLEICVHCLVNCNVLKTGVYPSTTGDGVSQYVLEVPQTVLV